MGGSLVTIPFRSCSGLNTVAAPEALTYDGQTGAWEAAQLVNLDVLDGGRRLRTRPGHSLVASGVWRDVYTAPNRRVYAVVDDVLVEVLADLSTRSLVALTTAGRVAWCALDDLVFWTNGVEMGLIQDGEAAAWGGKTWPVASEADRFISPPPGQVLGAYAGRVWIGAGSSLHFTEGAGGWHFYQDAVDQIEMAGEVTMIAPVDDGLYVGTDAGVWFMAGADPTKGMPMTMVSPFPAVLGTSRRVRSDNVTSKYNPAGATLWMSSRGAMLGMPSGIVVQLTGNRVVLDAPASFGAPLLLDSRYTVILHP